MVFIGFKLFKVFFVVLLYHAVAFLPAPPLGRCWGVFCVYMDTFDMGGVYIEVYHRESGGGKKKT